MDSTVEYVIADVGAIVAQQLRRRHHCFVAGKVLKDFLDADPDEVLDFRQCWDHLELDNYMADGGTYRYRRYGQFLKSANFENLSLLPHAAYLQSSDVNPLNGGSERHFEPLTKKFTDSALLKRLLYFMSNVYDSVEGKSRNWNIRLHPYRIYTNSVSVGQPTPEGLHRDGVTYIASLMIKRLNIMGGRTTITDSNRVTLDEVMLDKPFDIVMSDDEKTMHQVTSIKPEQPGQKAYRDVLVVAFTKIE